MLPAFCISNSLQEISSGRFFTYSWDVSKKIAFILAEFIQETRLLLIEGGRNLKAKQAEGAEMHPPDLA